MFRALARVTLFATAGCAARAPHVVTATLSAPHAMPATAATPAQCTPGTPALAGFTADARALDALAPATTTPRTDLRAVTDGHVAFAIPDAWFAARFATTALVAFSLRTGDPDDAFSIVLGEAPPYERHAGDEFRLVLADSVLVRGTVWHDGDTLRLGALALLPCTSPRFAAIRFASRNPARFARAVESLRSFAVVSVPASRTHDLALDPVRDRGALTALLDRDAVARTLALRALATGALVAHLPLDVVHPLADQVLTARLVDTVENAPVEVLVRLPVTVGHASAPPLLAAATDGSLAQVVRTIGEADCRAERITLAHDGLAVTCRDGAETRVLANDDDVRATVLAERFALVSRALHAWGGSTGSPGRPDAHACFVTARTERDTRRIVADGGDAWLANERCVVAVSRASGTVTSGALEGACDEVPRDGWGASVRSAGGFDELSAPGGTCRFTLGWRAAGAWLVAAGDRASTSAPVRAGATFAPDRGAVSTAMAFARELLETLEGRTSETPANVHPSVLATLGADRPGSETARATLRRWRTRTVTDGSGVPAVLGARVLPDDRVQVEFLAATVTVAREQGHWVVVGVE